MVPKCKKNQGRYNPKFLHLPNPKKSLVAPEKLNIRVQIDWVNKSPTYERIKETLLLILLPMH